MGAKERSPLLHGGNDLRRKVWFWSGLAAFCVLWLLIYPIWAGWIRAIPLDIAFPLNSTASITAPVEIRVAERYELVIEFDRSSIPVSGPSKHIEFLAKPETATSVNWRFKDSSGLVALNGRSVDSGASGWTQNAALRVIDGVQLQPGLYQFEAELTEPVHALASLNARIKIGLNAKALTSGALIFAWWGDIFSVLVIFPVLGISLLSLLILGAIHLRRG